jgi:hypothetical protein
LTPTSHGLWKRRNYIASLVAAMGSNPVR